MSISEYFARTSLQRFYVREDNIGLYFEKNMPINNLPYLLDTNIPSLPLHQAMHPIPSQFQTPRYLCLFHSTTHLRKPPTKPTTAVRVRSTALSRITVVSTVCATRAAAIPVPKAAIAIVAVRPVAVSAESHAGRDGDDRDHDQDQHPDAHELRDPRRPRPPRLRRRRVFRVRWGWCCGVVGHQVLVAAVAADGGSVPWRVPVRGCVFGRCFLLRVRVGVGVGEGGIARVLRFVGFFRYGVGVRGGAAGCELRHRVRWGGRRGFGLGGHFVRGLEEGCGGIHGCSAGCE